MCLAGSASKGLYRVHQFSKVEMFVLCTPQQSEGLLQELCDLEEEIFADLGLHFKILVNCIHLVLFQQWAAPLWLCTPLHESVHSTHGPCSACCRMWVNWVSMIWPALRACDSAVSANKPVGTEGQPGLHTA